MANLKPTTINGKLKVSKIKNTSGDTVINVEALNPESRTLRQIQKHAWTGDYAVSSWELVGGISPPMNGCKPDSLIQLNYYLPTRNKSTSWGGLYIEPQYRIDGVWKSLGSCGYDGGVMIYSMSTIGSYTNTILIDPQKTTTFSIDFRFYCKSYDGTTTINQSTSVNSINGNASLDGNGNSDQHYFSIIVEEFAKMSQ
jgi:hypothetical protein